MQNMKPLMLLTLIRSIGLCCLAVADSAFTVDDESFPSDQEVQQEIASKQFTIEDTPEDRKRFRRRFHNTYFYNYLDEMAMSICAAIPTQGPGYAYAIRRKCGEKASCKKICTHPKLKKQGGKGKWSCTESLHVYKSQPVLADNYHGYTDSHKIGLSVYRYHSCASVGCGPNYCCCRRA